MPIVLFTYRSTKDQRATFMRLQHGDGSTVELEPGETFVSPVEIDPMPEGLELVEGEIQIEDPEDGDDSKGGEAPVNPKTPARRSSK
jgi:hypothetical protein